MSVTDGNIPGDLAELTVRIDGAASTATPASQGAAGTAAGAWYTKLVDTAGVNVANVFPSGAVKVTIDTATPPTVNQGTAAALASAWPIKFSDGASTVNIALPGPNLGAGMVATTGALISSTSFTAATAISAGTVADFGSAKANISAVFTTSAGVSVGAVALEVSQDNVNWFRTGSPATLVASAVSNIAISSNAFRYARAAITTAVVGGTVSATLMAS